MNTKNIDKIFERVQEFQGKSLTKKISSIESSYQGKKVSEILDLNNNFLINSQLLESAFEIKRLSGQINVIVHAVGILNSLPYILKDGEIIEGLSLGAGNTGRGFDLETNKRVAEFKFITWQGGSEAIRQNQVFKDFYNLSEHDTQKLKELYVINKSIPIKFLNGSRALTSVMSKNNKLWKNFQKKYGNKYVVVNDYFQIFKHKVNIIDLAELNDQFESQIVENKNNRENKSMRRNRTNKSSSVVEVRNYVIEKYIKQAREEKRRTVRLKSRNIHDELDYDNRYPTVCQAIDSEKFLAQAKVRLISKKGPKKGKGSTVEWLFDLNYL